MILLILASCNKEEDHYESKNVKVDSVFDNEDKAQENNGSNEREGNQENKEDKNQNQEKNQNGDEEEESEENNPDSDNNAGNQNKRKYRATNSINLRTEPNTDTDNIILAIDLGTEFEAIEEIEANGQPWVKLEYQGNTGYVVKDLLEEVNN